MSVKVPATDDQGVLDTIYERGPIYFIDRFFDEKKQDDYPDYWRGSSAGMCMRRVMFQRLGVPPALYSQEKRDEHSRKTRVFQAGHIFHEFLQRVTRDAGISLNQEIELRHNGLSVRGHYDDLLLITDRLILVDYKSQHSMSFHWAKKFKRPMSLYHRLQLGTYLYILQCIARGDKDAVALSLDEHGEYTVDITEQIHLELKAKPLKEGRIVLVSKDDLSTRQEKLLWNPGLEKEVTQYWKSLEGYWVNKTIPRCTCDETSRDPDQKPTKNNPLGLGWAATEKYNDFYYEGEPCSLKWYEMWRDNKLPEFSV